MVDEMQGDEPAVVTPTHWLRFHGEPSLVVQRGSVPGEGIWLEGPGRALVRASQSPDARVVGQVESTWNDKAIRLVIEPAGAPPLWSDVFVRQPGMGPPELSRYVDHEGYLNGAYRAAIRANDGTPVGWFEVKLGDEQPCPVMYEAVLPPQISEGLAAASAAALGREIDWIDRHTLEAKPGFGDRP